MSEPSDDQSAEQTGTVAACLTVDQDAASVVDESVGDAGGYLLQLICDVASEYSVGHRSIDIGQQRKSSFSPSFEEWIRWGYQSDHGMDFQLLAK